MMPSKKELKKEREEIVKIMNIIDRCPSLNPMYKAEIATMLYGNNCRIISPEDIVISKSKYTETCTQEYDKAKFEMADSIWYYLERFIALTKEDYDYRVRSIVHGEYDVDD